MEDDIAEGYNHMTYNKPTITKKGIEFLNDNLKDPKNLKIFYGKIKDYPEPDEDDDMDDYIEYSEDCFLD